MSIIYTLEKLKTISHENNRLTVLDFDKPGIMPNGDAYKKIICKCSCGATVSVSLYHFIHGRTKSCGCYRVKMGSRFQKYHPIVPGIYSSHKAMIGRCYDSTHKSYRNYGGRGVVVCDEWKNDYQSFLDWALDNGWKESLELDKDIKGNGLLYSPESCCWVTAIENNNNRQGAKKYMYQGCLLTVSEISRKTNIHVNTLRHRLNKMGLSIGESLLLSKINK